MRNKSTKREGLLPLVEVFGSTLAVLILVFLFLNVFSGALRSRMLPPEVDEGDYRISWPGGTSGWVILAYSDRLKIVETQTNVFAGHICDADSPFVSYARTHYLNTGDKFIFAIFEGGAKSLVEARACLIDNFPGIPLRLGFIVADREFLKAISVHEIPPYIDTVLAHSREASSTDGETAGDP